MVRPRAETGRADLVAGTLTTRPPHLTLYNCSGVLFHRISAALQQYMSQSDYRQFSLSPEGNSQGLEQIKTTFNVCLICNNCLQYLFQSTSAFYSKRKLRSNFSRSQKVLFRIVTSVKFWSIFISPSTLIVFKPEDQKSPIQLL